MIEVRSGVFISHASRDAAYMHELAKALLEYGVPVWTSSDIQAGTDWEHELEDRLSDCDAVVVIMSPNSLASGWVEREIQTGRANGKKLLPLLLDGDGHEDLRDVQWEDVSGGRLPSLDFVEQLVRSGHALPRADLHELTSHSGSTMVRGPDRLPGRADLLRRLSRSLGAPGGGVVIDLVGVGGVGKTSLARMLAEMARPQFEAVFWVSYLNSPDPLTYLPLMSVELGLDDADLVSTEPPAVSSALARIMNRRRVMVVFDNVETVIVGVGADRAFDPAHESALATARRNPGRSCVLFTSRTPLPPPAPENLIDVQVPGVDLGAAQRILADDGLVLPTEEVAALVKRYVGNPFALVCAARTSSLASSAGHDAERAPTPASVSELIRDQLDSAPPAVRACLEYLALSRDEPDIEEMSRVLVLAAPGCDAAEVLQTVRARGWLPGAETRLAPVALEEITALVEERMAEELHRGTLETVRYLPLLPATLSEGSREFLKAAVLDRVVRQLKSQLDDSLVDHLMGCLMMLEDPFEDSYAAGNILNLLARVPGQLDGVNLPGRVIRNVDLRECDAPELNLQGASFHDVKFDQDLEGVTSVSVSPSGTLVAAGTANGDVHLLHAGSGKSVARCVGHRDVVSGLAFAADSPILATAGDDGSVRIWDSATGECRRELSADGTRLDAVAMTGDGQLIAAGGVAGIVFVWSRGKTIRLFQASQHHDASTAGMHVRSLAFNSTGDLLASGCSDGRVKVWDWRACELIFETEDQSGSVESVVFEPETNRLLASTRHPSGTRAFDLDELREVEPHDTFRWAGNLALSRDGHRAVNLRSDHLLELIDVQTGSKRELAMPRYRVQFCDVSSLSGLIAAGGDSHTLSVWDWESGRLVWTLNGFSRWIKAIDISPDGTRIACCADNESIRVWDLGSMRLTHELRPHGAHIRSIRFLPGRPARIMSGSDDRYLAVSDLENDSSEPILLGPHEGGVWAVAASNDGELLAAGCLHGQIRVWALGSSRPIVTLDGSAHVNVRSLAFNAAGSLLASCGEDNSVRVWDLRTGRSTPAARHSGLVWSVDFSPASRLGGDLIASSGEDQVVRVWSTKRSKEILALTGHRGTVWSARFSPDGDLIVTGSSDRTVRVWPISRYLRPWNRWLRRSRGRESHETVYREHEDWVRAVVFSPDGKSIASGSHDGSVHVRALDDGGARTLPVMRPYEGLDVRGSDGLSTAQLHALRRLGARVD